MSDILIKNMKMPTNCCECPLTYYEDGACIFTGIEALSIGIQNDCPLIEVPPHGRLIDADALLDRFEREAKSADEHGRDFSFSFIRNGEPCAEWWAVEHIVEDFITTSEVLEKE